MFKRKLFYTFLLFAFTFACINEVCLGAFSPIDVKCGKTKIGTLQYGSYEVRYGDTTKNPPTEHTGPKVAGDNWGGALFTTTFDFDKCPPGMRLRDGAQFRWLQIVTTSDPSVDATRGTAPTTGYVDPWSHPGAGQSGYEDSKPFYWTDTEYTNTYWDNTDKKLSFYDRSRRGFEDKKKTWKADLHLVCTWDKNIHVLGHVTWGWEMSATNVVTLSPAAPSWNTGATSNLASILNHKDEFGTDWKITNECCCVPTPSALLLSIIGCSQIGRFQKRRMTA